MSLSSFHTFSISGEHLADTERALSGAGSEGYERFAFWSGRPGDSGLFEVRALHVPQQVSYRTSHGLLVRVEGPELHRLNMWLFEHKQILAVQVHAHPTDAYHSGTDDAFPVVTIDGGLSIVVPNFCRQGLISAGTVIYRLCPDGWIEDATIRLEVL
jgi:hypothetical protein